MTRGMDEWAHATPGRIVTWPDPDAYVLVDGVLLRMLPHPPGLAPGTEVTVRYDPDRRRLVAHGSESGSGPRQDGAHEDGAAHG